MERQELRRGEHQVDRAIRQTLENLLALFGRRFAREHFGIHAERLERLADMVRLIGDERAQRIHEQAGLALRKGAHGCVHLEHKRLATTRGHDGHS